MLLACGRALQKAGQRERKEGNDNTTKHQITTTTGREAQKLFTVTPVRCTCAYVYRRRYIGTGCCPHAIRPFVVLFVPSSPLTLSARSCACSFFCHHHSKNLLTAAAAAAAAAGAAAGTGAAPAAEAQSLPKGTAEEASEINLLLCNDVL